MGVAGASHGNGVAIVIQAVVGFVGDGVFGWLGLQPGLKAAALDHEAIYDTMKNRAVIKTILDIAQKVLYGYGGLSAVMPRHNAALTGGYSHLWFKANVFPCWVSL